MKIKNLILTLLVTMGLSAQLAYPMQTMLQNTIKNPSWIAGKVGAGFIGAGGLLAQVALTPHHWFGPLSTINVVARASSGCVGMFCGYLGLIGHSIALEDKKPQPFTKIGYQWTDSLFTSGLQCAAYAPTWIPHWIQAAVGLGAMTYVYKKFPSIESIAHTARNVLLRNIPVKAICDYRAGHEIFNKNLLYTLGIAFLLSSEEDVDRWCRSIGIGESNDSHYLPDDEVREWQYDGRNRSYAITRKKLKKLKQEADKNKIRRMPFIYRPINAIISSFYKDDIDKKLQATILRDTQTNALIKEARVLGQAIDKMGERKNPDGTENTDETVRLPQELREQIFQNINNRSSIEREVEEVEKVKDLDGIDVSRQQMCTHILPYLKMSDYERSKLISRLSN